MVFPESVLLSWYSDKVCWLSSSCNWSSASKKFIENAVAVSFRELKKWSKNIRPPALLQLVLRPDVSIGIVGKRDTECHRVPKHAPVADQDSVRLRLDHQLDRSAIAVSFVFTHDVEGDQYRRSSRCEVARRKSILFTAERGTLEEGSLDSIHWRIITCAMCDRELEPARSMTNHESWLAA